MIRFDAQVLEKKFPELEFRVGYDDNKNPFLAYMFYEGDYEGLIWSFENIHWNEKDLSWVCEIFNYDVQDVGMDQDKTLKAIQDEYFKKFIETVQESVLESTKND